MDSKDNSIERQKYQLHKQGYEKITKAISDLKEVEKPEVQKMELLGAELVTIKGQKGDKGDSPTKEELLSLIEPRLPKDEKLISLIKPLIPKPIKGEDGKDYIITEKDKKDIAKSIKVPVVEKVIEKTETIVEKPIVKEVAMKDSPTELIDKLLSVKKAWLPVDAISGDFNKRVRQIIHTGASPITQQITVSDTEPVSPYLNQLWFDTS
jgi:hypothetical protein